MQTELAALGQSRSALYGLVHIVSLAMTELTTLMAVFRLD